MRKRIKRYIPVTFEYKIYGLSLQQLREVLHAYTFADELCDSRVDRS